jgi:hypothetical protein
MRNEFGWMVSGDLQFTVLKLGEQWLAGTAEDGVGARPVRARAG